MTDEYPLSDTTTLLQTLERKVKLLVSQSLINTLEISQLQQENARLVTQLGRQPNFKTQGLKP
ncbi:hypothetical protein [Candidatus Njordibacter sp. Uisw_002]|jgi:hypothetical protein|uniref:hypothetical protein n=1 Tax=Candidatus Njordibacter sp. Uisw_002 TaxID=3230971 RepID=UPI003D494481|tara:strand:- start:2292 stop:2480 length:189 start_codon:yes stop_codon:yes gene_type:complete